MGSRSGAMVTTATAARAILVIAAALRGVYGQSCGGSLTGSGTFTSPNYPGLYLNNANCQWNLAASDGNSAIQLFFSDIDLEIHYDVVEIYSGGVLMEQYQGPTPAHTAVYSSNVTVAFHTDGSVLRSGFSIFFNSTRPRCDKACYSRKCITWTPNFPYPFPKGSSCHWTIGLNGDFFVANVGFLAVDSTTVSPRPFTGTFEITRNYTNGSHAVDTYRSPAPIPPVTIGEKIVEVTFTSDRCHIGTGFMLSFAQLDTQCGQELVGSGTITTPNYPYGYPSFTICIWRLTALPGMRVKLTVLDISFDTRVDFVRIYSDNRLIGSYFGSNNPNSLTLGSEVIVEFQSDIGSVGRGLQASFISVP